MSIKKEKKKEMKWKKKKEMKRLLTFVKRIKCVREKSNCGKVLGTAGIPYIEHMVVCVYV